MRDLIAERHAESSGFVVARALNLVCIVDREWSGEIANRLRGIGRFHASRTIVCAYEPGRTTLDATANIATTGTPEQGEFALMRETIVVNVGPEHLKQLDRIVDPLVVTDVATVIWAPHGHPEAVDSLLSIAQVVLLDSVDDPDPRAALERVCQLAARAYVVDLAWLRTTPWRERIAARVRHAEPPCRARDDLVGDRAHPRGLGGLRAPPARLADLATRLAPRRDDVAPGHVARPRAGAARRGRDRACRPRRRCRCPASPASTSGRPRGPGSRLERGTGGLTAKRTERDGTQRTWTVLGASRGEPGILGEGLRQALVRDPTFSEALNAARELA